MVRNKHGARLHNSLIGPLGPNRQYGVALIFTSFFLLALVAALGLAIEIGRLYAAQSQLDNVAQLAAIQSARVIGACAASEPANPQMAADAAVQAAIIDNFGADNSITAQPTLLGMQSTQGGFSTFQPSNQFVADSTVVTLTRPAPGLLFGMFTAADQMRAVAGAVSRPQAGISVGSKLVDIGGLSGNNGFLSALLGGSADIGVVGYQGLADASVTIADLIAAQAGVATPEELLNTNLTLPQALSLLADAANNSGDAAGSAAANALNTLAGVADPSRQVLLGDILSIESSTENAVQALPINLADLLNGVAQAANTGSPVQLQPDINLGGLANVSGTINIIQPPQTAFGRAGRDASGPRTVARTSQVAIQLNVGVLGTLINLPLFIKVASAEATLDDIICAGLSKPEGFVPPQFEHTVEVGTGTSLATIGIGRFNDINALDPQPAANTNITLLNAGITQVRTTRNIVADLGGNGGGNNRLFFDGPFPPEPDAEVQTQRTGTDLTSALNGGLSDLADDLAEPGALAACVPLLGCGITSAVLAPVLRTVIPAISPVLDPLGSALLAPTFEFLGLDLGTADASVQAVVVNQPRLFCTGRSCLAAP